QSAATSGFHAGTPSKRDRQDPENRIAPAVTFGVTALAGKPRSGSRSFSRAAKAVNVVTETDICITGILIVAIARAAALGAESPGTTANHFGLALSRPSWIFSRRLRVIVHFVEIIAPFPDVAAHVVKAPRIRLLLADRAGTSTGILIEPRVIAELG